MSTWQKTAATLGLIGAGGFLLFSVSLVIALVTGLYVDHGQDLPTSFTIPGLAFLALVVVGAVMAAVEHLGRWLAR